MLKAFVFVWLSSGWPLALDSFELAADCDQAFAIAKKTMTPAEITQHRCVTRAEFEYGRSLAHKRDVETEILNRE